MQPYSYGLLFLFLIIGHMQNPFQMGKYEVGPYERRNGEIILAWLPFD